MYGGIAIPMNEYLGLNYDIEISIKRITGEFNLNTLFKHIYLSKNGYSSWIRTDNTFSFNKYESNSDSIKIHCNTKTSLNSEIDDSITYYLLVHFEYKDINDNNVFTCSIPGKVEVSINITDLDNTKIIATDLLNFNKNNYYTKSEIDNIITTQSKYITCWGDSLTAHGGWTSRLQELTGMTVYNGGTGGENANTICSRQGANAMVVNNIIIPSDTSEILISGNKYDGINTFDNKKAYPLLQGSSANGTYFNPCKIGDIEGTLRWTGSNYADDTGTWVFKRSEAGEAVTIDRPTILRTNYDMNKNNPYLMVIFMGQNDTSSNNLDTLVRQHRLMIEHANAEHSAASRADYETRMKQEFGRYFISLREYLSTPIYENGEIVSCYGIEDQDAEIDMDYISPNANNLTVKQEITDGIVPHAILADSVHYTTGTKTVIGDLIYKRCKELNIF